MRKEVFDDWPLAGERGLGWACRELRRQDRSGLQHHTEWVRTSGVAAHDRSVHEHHSLRVALHHMATYDRLQLCNLAGAEALNSRRQLVDHAHEGHPLAPRWDGAQDFLGYKQSTEGTLIDPCCVAHVAARQSQKAKIIEATLNVLPVVPVVLIELVVEGLRGSRAWSVLKNYA